MADKHMKTTSSRTLDGCNDRKTTTLTASPSPTPKSGGASAQGQLLNKLASNLSQSYQIVKQRQRKYNELSVKLGESTPQLLSYKQQDCSGEASSGGEWQEVGSGKNKLKRKKQLSSSLTSVTDSVNQEKRTRIEGIQLNCRGKLQVPEGAPAVSPVAPSSPICSNENTTSDKAEKSITKPSEAASPTPAALKPSASGSATNANTNTNTSTVPPPRLKRKLQENVQTIQKLNALTEQLRLEINELKSSLTTERGAVRVLRAQNESETRKWRNEVKKLQNAVELLKKNTTVLPIGNKKSTEATSAESLPHASNAAGSLTNYEIQRLTNEIIALKDANKTLEEKKLINCDADRRKAADMRTLKDSYEIRLTQLTKSAKTEISRLLEEIKTKERNIGQLKKELKVLQGKPQNEIKSRNATTNLTTNKTTTKTANIKPKNKNPIKNKQDNETIVNRKDENKEPSQAQNPNEDNNSDSDSALSSAPPSISPQPPPAGLDTADIWQMIRTYTTDIEKLQKDIEIVQKENEQLHSELNLAKEQILESEKLAHEAKNNAKLKQLSDRVKYLEEQEHQLQAEAEELREQNELLEFRILELEETNDKWSLQSHATPSTASTASHTASLPTTKDVWAKPKEDPMQLLFGNGGGSNSGSSQNMDSGITSPHSQHHIDDDLNLLEASNEELRRRIANMLQKRSLDEEDKLCLQQVLTLVQQLDIMSQRSGPNSLNTASCSSDEASSLDLVKSRISDYSSASSPSSSASSARSSAFDSLHNTKPQPKSPASLLSATPTSSAAAAGATSLGTSLISTSATTNSSRIVATVQPYNSQPQSQSQTQSHTGGPTNTPTDSPRKARHSWQSNSLSESGVFVESDFLSDASEQNAGTQTDFDDLDSSVATLGVVKDFAELQRRFESKAAALQKVPAYSGYGLLTPTHSTYPSPNLSEQKRLQYYKERLELLESKVLIYESSGDVQAKRLADRLQREIQLEKELKELRDQVENLECENATLEEEKCEFEEAENDTRLRLQRLEIELEILSQRNVELEMSREALSAKYKDCRSECLILRDDLSVSETQIRHLEEDKQKAKENLEFLHKTIPVFLLFNTAFCAVHQQPPEEAQQQRKSLLPLAASSAEQVETDKMGNLLPHFQNQMNNVMPLFNASPFEYAPTLGKFGQEEATFSHASPIQQNNMDTCTCHQLRSEVQSLRGQINQLNTRHYEAMESADSHWVDLEREYKDREAAFLAKECCLKQKINKLQDCLRDDARAANEKILQLEDAEKELKTCLLRVTKEHRDIAEEHQALCGDYERLKEEHEQLTEQMRPVAEALEQEKKRNKSLNDEIGIMQKFQLEADARNTAEGEALRSQINDLRKELLHIEVTNSELKEEVATLEQQIVAMQTNEKENEDKIRVLTDEVRSKEEMVQKLEKRLERSEGYSLAQELNGSPSKRFKREDVKDLKTATVGLGAALRNMKAPLKSTPKLILTDITRI